MNFGELLTGAGLDCPKELCNEEVSGIVTDSTKVTKNSIFICLRGSRDDGHDHIDEAVSAGARFIVAENVRGIREGGAALTYVDNTRLCASLLYNEWYGRPAEAMKIIGVTGTNGKTSVVCMLKKIFEEAGYSCGMIGTLGIYSPDTRIDSTELSTSNMTTPDPETLYFALAKMKEIGTEYVFMEVSSHALAQCRTDAISFDCAVFTNLSRDHLDFHGSMEKYYKAKEKIFTQSRRAIVNIDDAAGRCLFRSFKENDIKLKTCSRHEGDFCALFEEHMNPGGIRYTLKTQSGEHVILLPCLSGEFQVMNSLEAVAVAYEYGIGVELIQSALLNFGGVRGRMERICFPNERDVDIIIDYAHTPDALERLLVSVRKMRQGDGRIILLFGCGGDRDRTKRPIMGQVASRLADFVIITSDNSRSEDPLKIIDDIMKGIDKEKEFVCIPDRAAAIEAAVDTYSRAGDMILLAGKGHECYEIDSEGVHRFDEREIVKRALGTV